jgi:hypothetical protein
MKLQDLLEEQNDVLSVTIPLMIKLLEWAREEAKSDIDIHELVEKLAVRPGTLDTAVFDTLMDGDKEEQSTEPY